MSTLLSSAFLTCCAMTISPAAQVEAVAFEPAGGTAAEFSAFFNEQFACWKTAMNPVHATLK